MTIHVDNVVVESWCLREEVYMEHGLSEIFHRLCIRTYSITLFVGVHPGGLWRGSVATPNKKDFRHANF